MSDRIEAEILDVFGEEVDAAVDTPFVVIKGPKGDPGAKGDPGEKGDTGAQGAKGDAGAAGADGITPTIGDNGNWFLGAEDTGKPSRGAAGAKGDTGATGPAGPVGPQGPAGAPGKDGAGMDITGATAGQIAKIAAVDASGVPIAWIPVDIAGGEEDKFVLLSDTTIDEDVSAISMAIPPCKKIKAYFEGHQVFSDGSETSNKFTTLTPLFKVDGSQDLAPFYILNEASRFNSDVVSVITFDVSSPPFASGELFRIFPDGKNVVTDHNIVTNEIAITAASAITEITIQPKYKFVSGVGRLGRFASGGRFRIYGVKA